MVKNLLSDIPAVSRPNGPYCKRVKDSIATRPIEVEQGVVTPIDFSVSHSITRVLWNTYPVRCLLHEIM